ncbi:hypothetical protein [Salinigranum marinum]|uniref:hypothetical protein n=1 Tax=Salinigranum marinum TaxID=1515595 RepID=UPI002989F481|nr:hypothetical protein [Salinigranum marinum]
MNIDRLTLLAPGDAPNIDADSHLDDARIRETGTRVVVSVLAAAVGTDDVTGSRITVSGGRTAGDEPGRRAREFTYSGEVVDVSTTRWHPGVHRLRFACRPGSLSDGESRTTPPESARL